MSASHGTGRTPKAPHVLDQTDLHMTVAVSLRDGLNNEMSPTTFCESMASSIVTLAAITAVRAQVREELATTIKDALASVNARNYKMLASSVNPQLEKAANMRTFSGCRHIYWYRFMNSLKRHSGACTPSIAQMQWSTSIYRHALYVVNIA